METPRLTVVTPCLNEEEALPFLVKQLTPRLETMTSGRWVLLIVDDGSTDNTLSIIKKLNSEDGRVQGISLSRNFGHQPALAAGLCFSSGEITAIMDADLQDPVDVLEELYKKVEYEKFDVALGVRGKRDAPVWLRIAYKSFYRLIGKFADHKWPLDAGDFSVFNKKVLLALNQLPERERMLRGLRSWIGFKQTTITYARPSREKGESKYNLFRLISLALSALVGFTRLPLRIASLLGLSMSLLSLIAVIMVIVNRLNPSFTIFGYNIGANTGIATLGVITLFMSSMILFCLGIIGEYLALLVRESKGRPTAIIKEMVGDIEQNTSNGTIVAATE